MPSWSAEPEDSRKKGRGGSRVPSGLATGDGMDDLGDDDDDMAGERRRTTARVRALENSKREQGIESLRCREDLRQVK